MDEVDYHSHLYAPDLQPASLTDSGFLRDDRCHAPPALVTTSLLQKYEQVNQLRSILKILTETILETIDTIVLLMKEQASTSQLKLTANRCIVAAKIGFIEEEGGRKRLFNNIGLNVVCI